MSQIWDKLSTWKGRLGALSGVLTALLAIGGLIWSGTNLLATDKEVAEAVAEVNKKLDTHIQRQIESENRSLIQGARAQISDIDFQLLNENLPHIEKTFLEQRKQELKDLIACVQEGKHLCDQI